MSKSQDSTPGSQQQVVKPLYRWRITRLIEETYDGYGYTAKDAIEWLNANGSSGGSTTIKSEKARKVEAV